MQRGHEAANLGSLRQGLGGATNWPQGCPSQGWVVGRTSLGPLSIRQVSSFPGTPYRAFCSTRKAGEEVGFKQGLLEPQPPQPVWRALHTFHLKVCWGPARMMPDACVDQHLGDCMGVGGGAQIRAGETKRRLGSLTLQPQDRVEQPVFYNSPITWLERRHGVFFLGTLGSQKWCWAVGSCNLHSPFSSQPRHTCRLGCLLTLVRLPEGPDIAAILQKSK